MSTETDKIVDVALHLAETQSWATITLAAIAAEASMSLATLADHVSSKTDILRAFSRRIDKALLQSLESDPVSGEPHDRLFDIMLRRIELLAPNKRAVAGILSGQGPAPSEWGQLFFTALDSQGWTLAAAGIDSQGMRGDLRKAALAKIYADVLRIWIDDDDPGMARTMAQLDRKLRDAETLARRIETPVAAICGFIDAWRARRAASPPPPKPSEATHASAD